MDSGQCSNTGHNDGCHRLYKAAMTGQAEIPALVLTAAETLLIRSDAVPGPRPTRRAPGTQARRSPGHRTAPAPPDGGDPRC